ncbi:MAG: efflux RND transporter periplasmic adaptor subunit [Isosphaeraceae bacterium]
MVKNGLEVALRVQGRRPHQYRGKILFVDNTIDPTTSTVLVKASVPNPDESILPGEYVKVDLNIGDYVGVVVIPEQAVLEAQEGSRVLVVGPDSKVQAVVVRPLDQYQGLVVLESGLEDGQRVIVKGLQLVRPGQTVQASEADLDTFLQPENPDAEGDPSESRRLRIRGASEAPEKAESVAPEPAADRRTSDSASEGTPAPTPAPEKREARKPPG